MNYFPLVFVVKGDQDTDPWWWTAEDVLREGGSICGMWDPSERAEPDFLPYQG